MKKENPLQNQNPLILVRYRDLVEAGIVSNRMTLTRWMKRKIDPFPKPIRLGAGASGSIAWRLSEVKAWIEQRQQRS